MLDEFKGQGKGTWDWASPQQEEQQYQKPDNFPKHPCPPKLGFKLLRVGLALMWHRQKSQQYQDGFPQDRAEAVSGWIRPAHT